MEKKFTIKQIPEDFYVKEIRDTGSEDKISDKKASGHLLFLMKKKDYTTMKALDIISKKFNVPFKEIGFAGNKDRRAVTEQYFSVPSKFRKNIINALSDVELDNIEIVYVGDIDERLSLGELEGNEFKIIVRNLDDKQKTFTEKDVELIPNLFGEQRFSKNNVEVGRNILKKRFEDALKLITDNGAKDELDVKEHLEENKNDFVGAFKRLPKKIQLLYVHAYQSFLWNEAVKEFLEGLDVEEKKELRSHGLEFPVLGFDTQFSDKRIRKIYLRLLAKEKLNLRDFIIRQLPYLTCEGTSRKIFMPVSDFSCSDLEEDELNERKNKLRLNFKLEKGCYATTLIEYLFS